MEIVILEDCPEDCERLKNAIALKFHRYPALISSDPREILQYIETTQSLTLYFIDIVIHGKQTGLDIAKEITKRNRGDLIVFITAYSKLILGQTYLQVKSFNIIDKHSANVNAQIEMSLDLALEYADKQCFIIRNRCEDIYIPLHSIYFIESIKRSEKIRIHASCGTLEVNKRLKDCKKELDERFIYLRRTHIVNRSKIQRMDYVNKSVYFTENIYCPFSHHYAKKNGYRP